MAEDFALETDGGPRAIDTWWASRRLHYNIALLVAGPLGFGLYAVAVSRCIDLRAPGDWEITIFTTFFQGFAYLVMIGMANLCYYLGPGIPAQAAPLCAIPSNEKWERGYAREKGTTSWPNSTSPVTSG